MLHFADIPTILLAAIVAMPFIVTVCAILDQDNEDQPA